SGRIGAAGSRRDPDQVRKRRGNRPQLVEVLRAESLEERAELGCDRVAVVALQDPGRGLEDLRDRPVRDALAVREALSRVDRAMRFEPADQLAEQATLPDTGRADDRGDAHPALFEGRLAERREP